ncbi:tRNA lysidine(34) synthetase TilS [Neorhizobium sp. SOG26]|uniref:tRNA lysidine(34) synthetase TilS n=1 Tax=Neorhizobium sp. SOG26 TaxID=2060726 RepID=UPI000E596E11|nr:tRNA lysidine(34) synthetase TilS [Neorhizobium sp. SOG26]AXV16100.1 tRNA lysidine(34) synthetase TilS [Neorhizobium sp. SOG26]
MAPEANRLSPEDAVRVFLDGLETPAHLLVAISGGSDSTGLLLALAKLADRSKFSISAATIDHGLRPESTEEALAVRALCERLAVPHVIRRWEGEKPSSGISAAARDARYRLLSDIARDSHANVIVSGHTLDDQAETVSMRARRGDGEARRGLAGMSGGVLLERRHWLMRPLLSTTRADIRAFLERHGEGWIDDPSNLNARYERVRVRLAGPDAPVDSEAAARRKDLADRAADLIEAHVSIGHSVLAQVSHGGLTEELPVLRHALATLGAVLGGRTHLLGSDSMARVLAFIQGGAAGRITAGRVIFDRRRDGLFMMRENRGMLSLHVGAGETAVWDGRFRIINGTDQEVIVGPTAPDRDEALALFPEAPPAIAMRAACALPFVGFAPGSAQRSGAGAVVVEPILAPFDRFLPQFELNLANRIAQLIGHEEFTPLPVKDSRRKS